MSVATTWNPTPEQRVHAQGILLDLWDDAENEHDEVLAEIVKDALDALDLPYVRLEPKS